MNRLSLQSFVIICFMLLAVIYLTTGCQSTPPQSNRESLLAGTQETNANTLQWYTVYFTDPGSIEAQTYTGGPGDALAEAISQARVSVDVAAYSLNLWEIRDALLDAQRRGISIRMVTDGANMDVPEVQELIQAGIPVKGDHSKSLMHNKFFVIDRMEVWTGSMNPTLGGAYYDNNDLIRIRNADLAENYTVEFEEMFVESRFSRGSLANTPHPRLVIKDAEIETYFSPEDGTAERIVELIESAQESIYFLAYSLTSDDISAAIIDRSHDGIEVLGVMDESQFKSNIGTEYEHLLEAGIDVRLDGNPENMHHKLIILDKKIVITGSYNFSNSAETRNDENTLIIHSSEIAQKYLKEFWRVYNEAIE